MVKLKDIISTILNDMASARVEADIESLRIAETYSKDELLKNMPIPRMSIKNFTVTLPIAIDKVDEQLLEKARKPLTVEAVSSKTHETFTYALSRRGLSLSDTNLRNVKSLLKERLKALEEKKPWIMTQVKPLSDEIVTIVEPYIQKIAAKKLSPDQLKKTSDEFRTHLRTSLHGVRPLLPNLEVEINTASLQNITDKEKLVYITLNVDEKGLEWSVFELSTGETRERLVPE